jgi:hypothetical protein
VKSPEKKVKISYATYLALRDNVCPICGHTPKNGYYRAQVTESGKSEQCIDPCHKAFYDGIDISQYDPEKLLKQFK